MYKKCFVSLRKIQENGKSVSNKSILLFCCNSKTKKGGQVGTSLLYGTIVVVENVVVMDLLYLTSMINHCII